MKKRYIFTAPQQPEGYLNESSYKNPTGSALLESAGETRFPIMTVIANSAVQGDDIDIIVVLPDHANCRYNLDKYFNSEIEALKNKIGFTYTLTVVDTPFSELDADQSKLFIDIASKLCDNDKVYADVTFGNKPMPIVMLMALTYAHRFCKDITIEAIVYGMVDHSTKNKESFLFDVSSLFYMNAVINTLNTKISDPEGLIRLMLKDEEDT